MVFTFMQGCENWDYEGGNRVVWYMNFGVSEEPAANMFDPCTLKTGRRLAVIF